MLILPNVYSSILILIVNQKKKKHFHFVKVYVLLTFHIIADRVVRAIEGWR